MNWPGSQIVGVIGWQMLFVSSAILIILLEIIHGWRIGLMRQFVRIIAIVVAYVCALFAGPAVLPIARSFARLPDPVLTILGGAALGAILFAILNGIGPVLFKRTADHKSQMVRLIWGIGGGVLGILLGAFSIWLVFAGVRLIGSVADAQVRSRHALTSATLQPIWNRTLQIEGQVQPRGPEPSPLLITLSELKASLEKGPVGQGLVEVDPIPKNIYRTLERVAEVASSPDSAQRFLRFPGAQQVATDPKIIALRDDPQLQALIAQGRVLDLLQNKRMIETLNDPVLISRLKKFDLNGALDYALRQ